MTREAEARIMAKLRAGQTVTREDHVATIDDLAELDAFKAGVTEAGRMTETLLTAIYRRQVHAFVHLDEPNPFTIRTTL